MKKYEKPNLEELELILEGSFLSAKSFTAGKDDDPYNGDFDD